MGIIPSFLILLIISLSTTFSVYANHGQVLGVEVPQRIPAIPISQGPGLLLPTSPIYFVDLWRDNLSLILASYDPETKAKLHLKIAAERIVEVKLLMEAKATNAPGLDTALANITENIEGAKLALKTERAKGRNVEKLAKELDQTVDKQKEALDILAQNADPRTSLKIEAVQIALKQNDTEIEDELAQDALDDEIGIELALEIAGQVKGASDSARRVDTLLDKLTREASKSSEKALKNCPRIKNQITEKNQEERQDEICKKEEAKQKAFKAAFERAANRARSASREAQNAAEELLKSQKAVDELR